MRYLIAGLCTAVVLLLGGMPLSSQVVPDTFDLERIREATVLVMQARNVGDDLIITCVGSGTIVSRTGLVLTNAHNTVTSTDCSGDTLIIALSVRSDEPPVPKYRAEINQANTGLDLALLRINQQLDGRLIEAGTLSLPFVELGDSALVDLDDTVIVIGYPGIGNDAISEERGTVSAFIAEPSGGEKSWIKTSASIPGTMSGGGAYNRDGQLIGIPSTAPVTTQAVGICRSIQDTNNDGSIDNNDACVPIGGFINALRPSNFARTLVRAASLGLTVDPVSLTHSQAQTTGEPRFSNLFFSPGVIEGMPTTVIANLPTGSNSLYLFFDYENMTPTTVYEVRVTVDGIPNQTFSLAPVLWSGGEKGLWYVGSSGQPWLPGVYEFTLVLNGIAGEVKRLVVGGSSPTDPVLSNIVFGIQDVQGNIMGNAYVLPTGNIVSARFIYRNMQDGLEWTEIWYYEGVERWRNTALWQDGEGGSKRTSIEVAEGLPAGNYRLALYLGGNLAALSDFTIAGAQQGAFPDVFIAPHFATANSPQEAVSANPGATFPDAMGTLYTLFGWQQIAPGTLWTMRWSVDGDVFYEQTLPWNETLSGEAFVTQLSGTDGIPDGTYVMDLLVNDIQLASIEAQVGIGQLPIDVFAQASGVQLQGTILDSDTQAGIPGVTFVLISDAFSVEEFTWDADQIFAQATTDRNGRFQIPRLLQWDTPYSVVVAAQGYLAISGDGFTVTEDTPNPLDMTIELTHD
jgi:hypothetical protein